jgi:hypothetical protein
MSTILVNTTISRHIGMSVNHLPFAGGWNVGGVMAQHRFGNTGWPTLSLNGESG